MIILSEYNTQNGLLKHAICDTNAGVKNIVFKEL
jgi:hypothetical protein